MPHHLADDTETIASFLLTLRTRAVSPEPSTADTADADDNPSVVSESYHQVSQPSSPSQSPPQAYVDRTPCAISEDKQSLSSDEDIPVEGFLDSCKLVLTKDRDLVPDALFVAMAQMRPCKLTQADRVGCYKTRELGFVGMCCKHCGGQPGFGRYYPNSVRSLAQTTTSQTILKHVGSKCRFCPAEIRDAVNELQRQQAAREGMSTGRPRYGSRKIFFQRVWARLHGGVEEDEEDCGDHASKSTSSLADDASSQTPSDLLSDNSPATSDDEDSSGPSGSKCAAKRKFGFSLPTQKNFASAKRFRGPSE